MAKAKAADTYEYDAAENSAEKPAEKAPASKAPKAAFDFTTLNTLAVVSAASAATGFGAVAAVITGHVALSQIKKTGQSGRVLAIIGLAAGYTVVGLWLLGALGLFGFGMVTVGGMNGGPLLGGPEGMHHMEHGGAGQMQGFDQIEGMQGQQG